MYSSARRKARKCYRLSSDSIYPSRNKRTCAANIYPCLIIQFSTFIQTDNARSARLLILIINRKYILYIFKKLPSTCYELLLLLYE